MLDVAFIIGSKTDLPTVEESKMFEVWDLCGISWNLDIISADRNPGTLKDRCDQLIKDGVKVFVVAAGMAARLPGTVAAHAKYLLPIIGVALPSDEFHDALDSTLSITRPPAGCPVIFAGISKAGLRNAAIIVVQILANGEDEKSRNIKEKLVTYFLNSRKEPQLSYKKSQMKGGNPKNG